jgi:hypothetical protein
MILYNVTVNIEKDVEMEWLHWMRTNQIPRVLATGHFVSSKIMRLLNETENTDATYAIQYFAKDLATVEEYLADHAQTFVNEQMEKFKYKHVAFMSVLEEVL